MTDFSGGSHRLWTWLNLSDREQAGLQQWGGLLQADIPALTKAMTAILQQSLSRRQSLPETMLISRQQEWLHRLSMGIYDKSFWAYQEAIGQQYAEQEDLPLAVTMGFHRLRILLPQHLQTHAPDDWTVAELQEPLLRLLAACQHTYHAMRLYTDTSAQHD